MNENAAPTIRNLYPQFSDQELREAEENLDRYLALVLRIFERLESESHPPAGPLTVATGTLGSITPQPEASI